MRGILRCWKSTVLLWLLTGGAVFWIVEGQLGDAAWAVLLGLCVIWYAWPKDWFPSVFESSPQPRSREGGHSHGSPRIPSSEAYYMYDQSDDGSHSQPGD